jgi:hypothetical protein
MARTRSTFVQAFLYGGTFMPGPRFSASALTPNGKVEKDRLRQRGVVSSTWHRDADGATAPSTH